MKYKCPICHQSLELLNHCYQCENHHSFDVASYGYVNLNPNHKKISGDDKAMVQGRIRFLQTGAYDHLLKALNQIMHDYSISTLLDYACGPGYYTKNLNVKNKYGIDLSKKAIKYAAKHDSSSHYSVANGFNLPFFDHSFDAILVVFAPLSKDEFKRLLKETGYLIVVTPDTNHLKQLKEVLYDKVYLNNYKPIENDFLSIQTIHVSKEVMMDHPMIMDCFGMTPYKYKTSQQAYEKLKSIDSLTISCDFIITIYTKEKSSCNSTIQMESIQLL